MDNVIGWMQATLDAVKFIAPDLKTPYRLGEYVCMTEGHWLTAVKSDESVRDSPHVKGSAVYRYLDLALSGPEYDLAHLKEWSTREGSGCKECNGTKLVTCKECNGSGQHDCECTCGDVHDVDCDCENGKQTCECVPVYPKGKLFGHSIDLWLLHQAISNLPDGPYRVHPSAPEEIFVIGGDEWRVLIMPTKEKPEEDYEPREALLVR